MSYALYMFDGLDEIEQQLVDMINVSYPREFEKLVIQIAAELQAQVMERTPVDTSHLQESWKLGSIVRKGKDLYIEVYNNVEYVEHIEYGHRKRNSEELVPGAHMMEISLAVLEARLPAFLQDWLSNFLNTHAI